ncbi:hypothetical protein CEXT_641441 [Caerostris extrusa]|uniref:Uncharacterized protein n=1 Tax=Caerostris extrusa TaxID=172846 RepID=A0AAV4SLI1_CAEEX|nr:hypothetical protein CEXT_641441 [Caerostris extrusa]
MQKNLFKKNLQLTALEEVSQNKKNPQKHEANPIIPRWFSTQADSSQSGAPSVGKPCRPACVLSHTQTEVRHYSIFENFPPINGGARRNLVRKCFWGTIFFHNFFTSVIEFLKEI